MVETPALTAGECCLVGVDMQVVETHALTAGGCCLVEVHKQLVEIQPIELVVDRGRVGFVGSVEVLGSLKGDFGDPSKTQRLE